MEDKSMEKQKEFIAGFIKKNHFDEIVANIDTLTEYLTLLLQKNEVMNLTSAKNLDELCDMHLRDSLELFHALPLNIQEKENLNILDIGSGGGFPGIVTAIVKKTWKVTMLESITKKANFLSEVIEQVSLENATVKNLRAEAFETKENYHKFDIVTARAVGKIDYLYPIFKFFVNPNGRMVFWKKMDEVEPYLAKYPMKRQNKHLYEVADGKKSILIFSL
jgi:16S rRNA (guanine527-N7)-methyltransferase